MNIGSNKPGLCCPFNVQVNMSYKLFHMHRYLLILLDSALNTVGENVEYTKKKKIRGKNESLRVFHECAENLTKDIFFKLGVQVLSLV